jgi:flagellar motor protein MotB
MRRLMASSGPGQRALRRGGEATAGGDYYASMTDLMLGLVFIFIIMLMVFALDMRHAERRMTETTNALTEANLARRDLLREVAKILQGNLPVTIDEANGTLQLGGDILFPRGSADAYPEALPKLRLLGQALDQVLPCYAVAAAAQPAPSCALHHQGRLDAVYIEGHTDTTPIHTARFQNNWELSAARASVTFTRLVEAFPDLGMLKNDHARALIGVSGYGEYRSVDDSGTQAAMQRNRRIELRFIMATPDANAAEGVIDEINAKRSH